MGKTMLRVVVILGLVLAANGVSAAPMVLAVESAVVKPDNFSGQPTLEIELSPQAQRAFTKLTTRHVNEVVNLIIDGKVVSSPRVMTPIVGSTVVINGNFTTVEATALARRLSDGNAVVAVELAKE